MPIQRPDSGRFGLGSRSFQVGLSRTTQIPMIDPYVLNIIINIIIAITDIVIPGYCPT